MAEFASHNAKSASTSQTPFELNCGYHPCISFKKDINLYFQSKIANYNAMVMRSMIIWASTWSTIWFSIWFSMRSNMWTTSLIILETNKLYLHYYQTCHYWLPILVASCCHYWLVILATRHYYYYYYHWCYLSQKILWVLIKLPSLDISSYYLPLPFCIWCLSTKTNV